jgi:hypothetical protein
MNKEEIARHFLYATGMFDNRREIAANPQHHYVRWANTAAQHILDGHDVVPKGEIERLRASLRFAKGELECLRNWMDRAAASDYRYRDDPALPGHREAADRVARAIGRDLGDAPHQQSGDKA